jgi:hypothetical protein
MTMETYHWERKQLTEPPTTLSIIRTLPEGDSSGSDTSLPSSTDYAVHVFGSRRPTGCCGCGSHRHGATGARRFTL